MPKPTRSKITGKNAPPLNPAKLRAVMERTLDGVGAKPRSKEQRAQDLVYDAMEAATPQRRLDLSLQALELDPEHPDALLMVLEAAGFDREERIDALHGVVAVAAQRLGKKAFKELAPHFWGFLETRPYMRAQMQLAEELRAAGRLEDAIEEYEEMLLLNENDNQGVRYQLLPCLLAVSRLDEAKGLIDRSPDECEWNVVFSWGRVLERLLSGDAPGASSALAVARKQNPHMEVYLKGHRKVPKYLPATYSPGSKEEALCFVEPLLMAWQRHPEAQAWLAGRLKMDDNMGMDRKDTP